MPENFTPMKMTAAQLAILLKSQGCRECDENFIQSQIKTGAPLNQDGTIDLFDYVSWLIGTPISGTPPPRMPPQKMFNIQSVSVPEMCGWLECYNHIGYSIQTYKIDSMCRKYRCRFEAKQQGKIDFLRFAAFAANHSQRVCETATADSYERHKNQIMKRQKIASAAARDIGELPETKNIERKEACRKSFRLFCETYFASQFPLAWSDDHFKCIAKIENAVLQGGTFAFAMPRGSGKTTISETAAIWCVVYGHREYVALIGATETAAMEMLDSIKSEFEHNDILFEDFPEVCFPIRCIDGIALRCKGQTYNGKRTLITWSGPEIVLPTIEGSEASSHIIHIAGITGRVRGMKYKKPDGTIIRPSLVIIDDPQTRESACSLEQIKKRMSIISGDILGLAGPGNKIAGVMPCTVINPGDVADQLLDKEKHPEWQGERAKMMYQFPSNMLLWDEYSLILADSIREDGNIERATGFYQEHREEMDEGAAIGWPERFNHDEISAVQNAMNLYYRDTSAFSAEYQNEPLAAKQDDVDKLMSSDAIAQKVNSLPQYKVPLESTTITMFVDVQKTMLFYSIIAWNDETFSGAVIDYGTYPEQGRRRFTLASASPTMHDIYPHDSLEGYITKSLQTLFETQMQKVFEREDGMDMHISMAAVDASWGDTTEAVYQFCRRSEYSSLIIPSHGHYVGASSKPMSEYRKQPGDKIGLNWRIPSTRGTKNTRHILYDTNYWKTFVHERLAVDTFGKGSLTFYGKNPLAHELIAEHLTAEYRVKTTGRGRTVYEWKLRTEKPDNHWFDCVVGCAVLASYMGASIPQLRKEETARKTIRLSDVSKHSDSDNAEIVASEVSTPVRRSVAGQMKLSELQKLKRQ